MIFEPGSALLTIGEQAFTAITKDSALDLGFYGGDALLSWPILFSLCVLLFGAYWYISSKLCGLRSRIRERSAALTRAQRELDDMVNENGRLERIQADLHRDNATLIDRVVRLDSIYSSHQEEIKSLKRTIAHNTSFRASVNEMDPSIIEKNEKDYTQITVEGTIVLEDEKEDEKEEEGTAPLYFGGRQLSENTAKLLQCCICLLHMTDPVTLACGHSSCKACIEQCLASKRECPECRRTVPLEAMRNLNVNVSFRDIISKVYPKPSDSDLRDAIGAGNLGVVRDLLDRGAAIDATDGNNWTPLHVASNSGRIDVVNLLLDHGAAIDATAIIVDDGGGTPLHLASRGGHIDVVNLLLDRGAAIDATDDFGRTPLHVASSGGCIDAVVLLLDRGAAIDAKSDREKTPLHVASEHGVIDVVLLLLDRGAAIDAKSDDGWTPLHRASEGGRIEIVNLLLDRGAAPLPP